MTRFRRKARPEVIERMMKSIDSWMLAGDLTNHVQNVLDHFRQRPEPSETEWGRRAAEANALWQSRCDGSSYVFQGVQTNIPAYTKAIFTTKSKTREVRRGLDWKLWLERKLLAHLSSNEAPESLRRFLGDREFRDDLVHESGGERYQRNARQLYVVRTKLAFLLPEDQRIRFLPLYRRATVDDEMSILTRHYAGHVHVQYEDGLSWIDPPSTD